LAIHLLERQDARIITILSDTYDNIKDGILTDYEDIFQWSGLNLYDYYNKQEKVLTWGKSKIQFRYIADHKPHAGKSKRRQILYINEGNKIGWAAAEPYISRSKEVFIDFNPDFEFWAHTELEPRDDCEKIVVTFLDNELCPENEVRYIESRKENTQWYRVYGLGLTGTYSDRRIYSFEMVDEVPETAKRIPSGMDFGQSPDPTCLIDVYVEGTNLYLDQRFSENNLMPEKIQGAERMAIVDKMEEIGFPKGWMIIGDSSGKTELVDLRKHGYNARGVKKGAGSVATGIKRMRSYNLKITKRSTGIKTGCESWFWKIDHNGKIVPEPDGHEPDELAAVRYVCLAKSLWG
jgi:phage terminase large subunit